MSELNIDELTSNKLNTKKLNIDGVDLIEIIKDNVESLVGDLMELSY